MLEKPISALLACACTAALLSCIPAAGGSPPPPPLPDLAAEAGGKLTATPVASSAEIAGEWDIVSFDGYEPRRLQGTTRAAFADFRDAGVALRIECNYSGASGRVVDGTFRSQPDDGLQTAMGCGPEREARDAALFGFFDRDPSVERLSDGRLLLIAGDDRLILQRPAQRRLAFLVPPQDLLGEWRMVQITRYHEGGGYSGIGLSETPGRIAFDGISAGHTRCPQYAIAYRYTDRGIVEKLDGPALPTDPAGCAALAEPMRGTDMPLPWDVLRVLHADPMIERIDDRTILMSTEGFGVELIKAPCESLEQSDDDATTRTLDCASPR